MSELKPCPFCGGKKIQHEDCGGLVELFYCDDCGATGPSGECKSELAIKWNAREQPTIAEYLTRIAGLEKSLKAMAGFAEHQMNPMVNDPSSFTGEDFGDLKDALKLLEQSK